MRLFRHTFLMQMIMRLVVAMIVLPHVLAVVPSFASAAERTLYADLMESRCLDMDGDGKPDGGALQHNCNDCCLACTTPQLTPARLAVVEPVHFDALSIQSAVPILWNFAPPPSEAVFRPLSQRGPPA